MESIVKKEEELYTLVEQNNVEAVKALLLEYPNLNPAVIYEPIDKDNDMDFERDSATQVAAVGNSPEMLEVLLNNPLYFNSRARTKHRENILFHAVAVKAEKAVKYLLEKGLCVNQRDNDGWTALHYVAFDTDYYKTDQEAITMARLLLKYGANVSDVTFKNETVVDIAQRRGKTQFLAFLSAQHSFPNASITLETKPFLSI